MEQWNAPALQPPPSGFFSRMKQKLNTWTDKHPVWWAAIRYVFIPVAVITVSTLLMGIGGGLALMIIITGSTGLSILGNAAVDACKAVCCRSTGSTAHITDHLQGIAVMPPGPRSEYMEEDEDKPSENNSQVFAQQTTTTTPTRSSEANFARKNHRSW